MTDPTVAIAVGVSIFATFLAFCGWATWSRPAEPPRFRGYAVRQGWKVDPIALLDQDLRRGRLAWAVTLVHDRLVHELTDRHGLTPREIVARTRPGPSGRLPAVDRACRVLVSLEATYQIAYRAEDPHRTDVWSAWRKPVWRAAARRRFENELTEVEGLWAPLEAAA
ncbi:MAG: hypothetical protein WB809_05825 [Thermoplasmata archaeon]